MTGPDHYREAERLTVVAFNGDGDRAAVLAAAQVHATLALAAATAMNGHSQNGMSAKHFDAWNEAAGVAYARDGGDQ